MLKKRIVLLLILILLIPQASACAAEPSLAKIELQLPANAPLGRYLHIQGALVMSDGTRKPLPKEDRAFDLFVDSGELPLVKTSENKIWITEDPSWLGKTMKASIRYQGIESNVVTLTVTTPEPFTLDIPINGNEMQKGSESISLDAPATIRDGRLYLPARAVSEALGARVLYEQPPEEPPYIVIDSFDGKGLALHIGQKSYTVFGEVYPTDAATWVTDNGRSMVPARVISDVLGLVITPHTDKNGLTERVTIAYTAPAPYECRSFPTPDEAINAAMAALSGGDAKGLSAIMHERPKPHDYKWPPLGTITLKKVYRGEMRSYAHLNWHIPETRDDVPMSAGDNPRWFTLQKCDAGWYVLYISTMAPDDALIQNNDGAGKDNAGDPANSGNPAIKDWPNSLPLNKEVRLLLPQGVTEANIVNTAPGAIMMNSIWSVNGKLGFHITDDPAYLGEAIYVKMANGQTHTFTIAEGKENGTYLPPFESPEKAAQVWADGLKVCVNEALKKTTTEDLSSPFYASDVALVRKDIQGKRAWVEVDIHVENAGKSHFSTGHNSLYLMLVKVEKGWKVHTSGDLKTAQVWVQDK